MNLSITLRNDFSVGVVQGVGSDEMICQAAQVSTLGSESIHTEESKGLLAFLMSNRHGTPFEHGFITYRIEAPIFVWREFMRHRIGFSYNEESGRYKVLNGEFYVPPAHRPLVQVGKTGAYEFVKGDAHQQELVEGNLQNSYQVAWDSYQYMLSQGVAKEVARMCLPVATYSSAYVSCNPRSLMSFLSLRTKYEDSMFPSFPQWEINRVADEMEEAFRANWPLTHDVFNTYGRVAP